MYSLSNYESVSAAHPKISLIVKANVFEFMTDIQKVVVFSP